MVYKELAANRLFLKQPNFFFPSHLHGLFLSPAFPHYIYHLTSFCTCGLPFKQYDPNSLTVVHYLHTYVLLHPFSNQTC